MYLHMGGSAVADCDSIIGVFDLDHVSWSHRTRQTLAQMEAQGTLHTLGRRLPVSLVVTKEAAYLSPVSSAALGKRLAEDRWE